MNHDTTRCYLCGAPLRYCRTKVIAGPQYGFWPRVFCCPDDLALWERTMEAALARVGTEGERFVWRLVDWASRCVRWLR